MFLRTYTSPIHPNFLTILANICGAESFRKRMRRLRAVLSGEIRSPCSNSICRTLSPFPPNSAMLRISWWRTPLASWNLTSRPHEPFRGSLVWATTSIEEESQSPFRDRSVGSERKRPSSSRTKTPAVGLLPCVVRYKRYGLLTPQFLPQSQIFLMVVHVMGLPSRA